MNQNERWSNSRKDSARYSPHRNRLVARRRTDGAALLLERVTVFQPRKKLKAVGGIVMRPTVLDTARVPQPLLIIAEISA